MNATDKILELLTPVSRPIQSFIKEDIQYLLDNLEENETVESLAIGSKKITYFLYLLTSKRLLTIDKKDKEKVFVEYNLDEIENLVVNGKFISKDLIFHYRSEEIKINFSDDAIGKIFTYELEKIFGKPASKMEIKKPKKPISIHMTILNGKEQITDKGKLFEMLQDTPGQVNIKVDFKLLSDTFSFVKWERVENIQKSAMNIVGWTVIGSTWGNAGALAGAMGGNIGKDKSVATLYLIKENGEKVALVVKCDKKDLQKLSLFILSDEEKMTIQKSEPPLAIDDLIKLKELVELGIITEDEFTQKKKQLLGI